MSFPLMPMIIPTSRPGISWEDIGNPAYGDLRMVASDVPGSIMAGAENYDVLYSSDYGSTFSTKNVAAGVTTTYGVGFGFGKFVVTTELGLSTAYASSDEGDTWATAFTGALDNHSVTFNDGYFVVGTGIENGDGFVYFSSDGVLWRASPSTGNNSVQCGIYVGTLNRTFACGISGQGKYRDNVPPYSGNGDTWTASALGLTGIVYNVAWSETLGLAVCASSTGIFRSSSMISWTQSLVTTSAMRAVAWCGDVFVAVGLAGKIYTSTDGASWTERTSGTTEDLYGVVYSNGTIIATGDNGTVLRSS